MCKADVFISFILISYFLAASAFFDILTPSQEKLRLSIILVGMGAHDPLPLTKKERTKTLPKPSTPQPPTFPAKYYFRLCFNILKNRQTFCIYIYKKFHYLLKKNNRNTCRDMLYKKQN